MGTRLGKHIQGLCRAQLSSLWQTRTQRNSNTDMARAKVPGWVLGTQRQSQVLHGHQQGGETQSCKARCTRTQLSPTPSPSWGFSHNLQQIPLLWGWHRSQRARGEQGWHEGARKWLFLEQKEQRKADCVRRREKVAMPPRAALIPATPNPPEGSPSCAAGQCLQHLKWENVILLRLLELHSQHLHCSRAYKGRLWRISHYGHRRRLITSPGQPRLIKLLLGPAAPSPSATGAPALGHPAHQPLSPHARQTPALSSLTLIAWALSFANLLLEAQSCN